MLIFAERFWSKVQKTESGCWLWTSACWKNGYGFFKVGGRKGRNCPAHRVAYELIVGPVPVGHELDHLCRVRSCVNPAHLEPVTHAENVRRGDAGKYLRERTHCPQGHAYDETNTYIYRGRRRQRVNRQCRTCMRQRSLAFYHRQKSLA